MKIAESPHEAYAHIDHWRRDGLRIGFVPTMGALHAGHFSLVDRSVQECDITAVSIFVNPTQFAPDEDLERYPRPLTDDLSGLRAHHVDLVFTPTKEQLYPAGFSTYIEPPEIGRRLEGQFRSGHFRGVTTIVLKLFQVLPADIAYFGQKDFQQLAVIRRMVEDLNVPIRVEGCPTVREADGLALSSRNQYLAPEQRELALSLYAALKHVESQVQGGERSVQRLEAEMFNILQRSVDRIDYARLVSREWLKDMEVLDQPSVALIAAHVGTTRLIDNLLIEP